MGNFKMKKDTLVSPRNYQGKAPIIGMSNEEAQNIDEHDNAIPKKEVVVKKDIPNITMDNNLQTATGGTRYPKSTASKRTLETLENLKDSKQEEFSTSGPKDSKDVKKYNKKIQRLNKKIDRKKPSAGKKTPEKLPPTKEEQPKTQSVNKKEEDNKPKQINIKKPETQSLETKFRELKAKFGGKIRRVLGEPNDPPKKLKNTGYTGQ